MPIKFQVPRGNSLLCNSFSDRIWTRRFMCFKSLAGIHSSATWLLSRQCLRWDKFQVPRGNSLLCNSPAGTEVVDALRVSSPSREFTPLQLGRRRRRRRGSSCFKSLAGIHSSATPPPHATAHRVAVFQVPRGNSLLCNSGRREHLRLYERVSSPSREFTPLQPDDLYSWISGPLGFKSLAGIHSSATAARDGLERVVGTFQVPRGNSLLCNLDDVEKVDQKKRSFKSLAGIHSSATRFIGIHGHYEIKFQVPRGNSLLCNYGISDTRVGCRSGFKSLAGIHSSATHPHIRQGGCAHRFQVPRGNSLLCNRAPGVGAVAFLSGFKSLAGIHSSATYSENYIRKSLTPFQVPRGNSLLCNWTGDGCRIGYTTFQVPRGNSLLCNSAR